jgi:hypothetical protein
MYRIVQQKLSELTWYQLTGIALVLGGWAFFLFYFKASTSWILQKTFRCHFSLNYGLWKEDLVKHCK